MPEVSPVSFWERHPILKQVLTDAHQLTWQQLGVPAGTIVSAFIIQLWSDESAGHVSSLSFAKTALYSLLLGCCVYVLVAIVRAPFVVIGNQHKRLLALQSQMATIQTSAAPASSPQLAAHVKPIEPEPNPNLVCKKVLRARCHWSNGVLVEGHSELADDNCFAYIAVISNDFTSPRAGSVANLAAQIFYRARDHPPIEVNRGAWLSGGNWTNLAVNDTDELIICFAPAGDPFPLIMTKDYTGRELPDIAGILSDGQYAVEVRLISEDKGEKYTTINFDLVVAEEPKFKVELFELSNPTLKASNKASS